MQNLAIICKNEEFELEELSNIDIENQSYAVINGLTVNGNSESYEYQQLSKLIHPTTKYELLSRNDNVPDFDFYTNKTLNIDKFYEYLSKYDLFGLDDRFTEYLIESANEMLFDNNLQMTLPSNYYKKLHDKLQLDFNKIEPDFLPIIYTAIKFYLEDDIDINFESERDLAFNIKKMMKQSMTMFRDFSLQDESGESGKFGE